MYIINTGADPGFQVSGGGTHLKKSKIFGVFRVKNHDFMQKNHIFSNFRGGARRGHPPPGSAPEIKYQLISNKIRFIGCSSPEKKNSCYFISTRSSHEKISFCLID